MQLRSLEIQGFKSFPDRVKLNFDRGITAVVGPNGSGKSNLVDAVRWVFGEQSSKTLRGSKMEDVIFGGTALRKPQGYATVSLCIDNSDRTLPIDDDEVIITRKLYRSGDSEYRLCGTAVRLKDVHELFMDTGLGRDGYSIIGQGKIAEIISSKSDERREIFEEAAGISKYRYRRAEAERRLALAEENMLRLRDILAELEERVGPLERESRRAAEFVQLAEERRTLEISVWVAQLARSRVKLAEQDDRYLQAKGEHDELEAQVTALEEEIALLFDRMQQYAITVDGLRTRLRDWEGEQAALRADVAVKENDIRHNEESAAALQRELQGFSQSEQALAERLQAVAARLEQLRAAAEEIAEAAEEEVSEQARLAAELQALDAEGERLRARRAAVYANIDGAKLHGAASLSRLDETHERLAALQHGNAARLAQERALADEQSACAAQLEALARRQEELQNARQGYQRKLEHRRARRDELEERRRALAQSAGERRQRARLLEEMERSFEGYAHSVKYILQCAERGTLKGVHGPVSRILTTDEQYATAIEIALGGAMQHIVVTDEASAKQAIRLLAREHKGRGTFLPMTTVKGRPIDPGALAESEGYVGIAGELVQYDSAYAGIVQQLLGRILIAADLDCAVRMAGQCGYRWRIVTLDGQVVNTGGSLTGGSVGKGSGILSRRTEYEHLRREAETLSSQAAGLAEQQGSLETELSAIEGEMSGLDAELQTLAEARIRTEGEQRRIRLALEQAAEVRAHSEQEEALLRERLAQLAADREDAGARLALFEQELAEVGTGLEALQQRRTALEETSRTLREAVQSRELRLLVLQKDTQAAEEDGRRLRDAQQNNTLRRDEMSARIAQLAGASDEIVREIAAIQLHLTELDEQSADARERIRRSGEQRNACEQRATALRGQVRELGARKETAARNLVRLEERRNALQADYDALVHRLWDAYELTRSQAEALAVPIPDLDAAQQQLTVLRGRIKALGNVNVAAIEEYREVSGRYNFLRAQLQDVEQSQRELHRLIAQLTDQMEGIFSENFTRIDQHFGRIFADLFGGGKASLTLTDREDVLGSGIEIHVQPPGKVIRNLAALSGGEQAFVAIAIYFAILKVNPSPFVLLDEIEAALDDVNVSKYAQYLRTLTGNTQFIAITHRRGTMEEADVLYGVTMQEEGVSKMIELRVSELEQQLGMPQ